MPTLSSLPALWPNLTLQDYLRSFYLLAAAFILLLSSIPQLSTRFISYGKTAGATSSLTEGFSRPNPSTPSTSSTHSPNSNSSNPLTFHLNFLSILTVPHAYFTHFYLLSLTSSFLWGHQLLTHGTLLQTLLTLGPPPTSQTPSMTKPQIWLAWTCLLIQGLRRFYEQAYVLQTSRNSKMLLPHYLLGYAFYLTVNIAIFIEARPILLSRSRTAPIATSSTPRTPLVTYLLSLHLFLISSVLQHLTHIYLSHLPKYSLPPFSSPLFTHVLSPHYLYEILIYLSLAILTAPQGGWINGTMMCVVLFVLVNLGVSAGRTGAWYREKFGERAVAGRRNMIPWVY